MTQHCTYTTDCACPPCTRGREALRDIGLLPGAITPLPGPELPPYVNPLPGPDVIVAVKAEARLALAEQTPAQRKAVPIATGFIDYFPDAIAEVAACSKIANEQHNPGKPMFWDRTKSTDEADCLIRHFVDRGTTDTDGIRHSTKVAWRALALLQKEIETSRMGSQNDRFVGGEYVGPGSS